MPRKEERISYLNEAILEWSSGRREARISDLSMGGCFVDTIAVIPEGEKITFELRVNDGRLLRFEGKVAYALSGIGFGIEFTDLSEETKQFLAETTSTAE
ncbi:MAG TPA: PilZ domain-containing protein [Pyrinomonadaceae bacterium]|nr:PilZ domain-containing protein [Pyrinomonadaceae bacterium]